MRAGGSQDISYTLAGALPAGNFVVAGKGSFLAPAATADLHVELLVVHQGTETTIAAGDATFTAATTDGGQPGFTLSLTTSSPQGACGDKLILRTRYASGSETILFFSEDLTLP